MSTDSKRILVFSDWFLPGFRAGGPIRSLANLVNALPYRFFIVTSIKDHHHHEPYDGIVANEWTVQSHNVQVMYLSDDKVKYSTFQDIITTIKADKIYFNSIFSPCFTIMPLRVVRKLKLQERSVIAPRGMLKPGALSVKKGKKKVFLLYAKLVGLYSGIRWHATNEEEVSEIKNQFGINNEVVLAPNLPSLPALKPQKPEKSAGDLKLICVARISPEKGILEAIQYLHAAKLDGNVVCDFYGTQQNEEYLKICMEAAMKGESDFQESGEERKASSHSTGKNDKLKISFKGEIAPEKIADIMKQYHFFYMTTWGENFGHAIAEALNNATPVLISNTTPWQGLEEKHAGWVLPMDARDIANRLHALLNMDDNEYKEWCDGAYKLGYEKAHDPQLVKNAMKLFA